MTDIRLQRLAQVLVHYSLDIKKGDRLAINTGPSATPLAHEIVREALRVGAYPETFVSLPGIQEILLREGSDEQLSYIPNGQRFAIENFETSLQIYSQENTKELSGIDPARIALQRQGLREISQTYMQRSAQGDLRWCIAMFPTNAYAQDANMSLSDFEDFVYRACFLDTENPVERWQALSKEQEHLVQWLQCKHTIHVQGQDTDLTLSIAGRSFLNSAGLRNFPDGEFFTSPLRIRHKVSSALAFPPPLVGARLKMYVSVLSMVSS